MRQRRWQHAFTLVIVVTVALVCTIGTSAVGASSTVAAPVPTGGTFYLALGGSASLGLQPTVTHPLGQPTATGYANDLTGLEHTRWPDLHLVQLGCPGETTAAFLSIGDRCRPAGQTQLAQAVAFLHSHPTTVLMTIDLGFNDVLRCLARHTIDPACINQNLAAIRQQLPPIIAALRNAASPKLRVVGVGHYDPYLGAFLHGGRERAFAEASVDTINRLNATLHAAYMAADIPMADVAGAFGMTQTATTELAGLNNMPENVVRTCAWTWVCAAPPLGPNKHPNDAGYQVIAEAIADVIPA